MVATIRPIRRRFKGPNGQEDMPYLLTPGPLTTSRAVNWSASTCSAAAVMMTVQDAESVDLPGASWLKARAYR